MAKRRPDTPQRPAADCPRDVAQFGDQLRHAVAAAVLRSYGPADPQVIDAVLAETQDDWLRAANETLIAADRGYRLHGGSGPDEPPLRIEDRSHGVTFATAWGELVTGGDHLAEEPVAAVNGEATIVDWGRLIAALADLRFLEGMYYKVSRLSVVFDPSLYPFWVVGHRRLRRNRPQRPEVGVHFRFLQEMSPRLEARLYRALTARWEVRRDQVAGVRRWFGRRRGEGSRDPEGSGS